MNRISRIELLISILLILLLMPSLFADNVQTDIEYGQADGESLLLDACVSEGDGPFPIAIIVHGGGWSSGDKQRDITMLFEPLTNAEIAWFSINYRMAPKYKWPACLEDVQTAIHWVRKNAEVFKGDPNRITLIGYSAGGQLAFMAAMLAGEETKIQALIGFAPPTDLVLDTLRRSGLSESLMGLFHKKEMDDEARKLLWDASPINHLKPDLPPILLIHGNKDTSVPYQQSFNFQTRCNSIGIQCDLITVIDAPHRITAWSSYDSSFKRKMIDWLEQTVNIKEQSACTDNKADFITVTTDGTSGYTSVQAAVDAVPKYNKKPVTIHIKPGTYKELVVVPRTKRFITFKGDDAEATVLTYDLNARMIGDDGKEIGTFRTPSVTIEADDFTAGNITFENSAGPVGQALAMTVIGDRVVFRNCRFLGWQDTLLDQAGRHYYENCYITGHVDFIFGAATSFFEDCHIHCLRKGYITAASTPEHQPYGYVFSNCRITGEPDVITYLGRPWRDYANVIFMNTEMSEVVRPQGWNNWRKPYREKTARYYEYNSTGPGANTQERVSWARTLTKEEAEAITVENVLGGKNGWNPKTGTVKSSVKLISDPSEFQQNIEKELNNSRSTAYLSTAYKKNGKGGLYLTYSYDGIKWANPIGPFIKPQVGSGRMMREPYLLAGTDGIFHLVWTTSIRGDLGFGYACSSDLIKWSQQKFIELMAEHKAFDVVGPKFFYDENSKRFIIIWASTLPGNYYQAYQEDVQDNPRLWYTTTTDFKTFTPAEPFCEPGYSIKDGIILTHDSCYVLLHKDNRKMMNTLRVTFADTPVGPWGPSSDPIVPVDCESPFVQRNGNEWIVYYSFVDKDEYGAVVTQDFEKWTDISDLISLPKSFRFSSVLKIDRTIIDKIANI